MKVIICGPLLSEELEMQLAAASPAAGKFLRNLKEGLEENGIETETISFLTIPGAKALTDKQLKEEGITYISKSRWLLDSLHRYHQLIYEYANREDIVLFYNYKYTEWGVLSRLRRKGVKCVLVLADHTGAGELNHPIRKFMAYRNEKAYRQFSHVILLSAKAGSLVNPKAKQTIIEGGIRMRDYLDMLPPRGSRPVKIMYAGTLSPVTGVDILLRAMKLIEEQELELYISGRGELEEEVLRKAEEDKRIKPVGFISNEEYYQLLGKMDIVVNPRNMDFEQNQNNFPSKVLEYLASGRMVISTRFPGWEQFEENFCFYHQGEEELAEKIKTVIKLSSEVYEKCFYKNREAALGYGWKEQAGKILELVKK